MVIITDSTAAKIVYTESQWLDASDSDFGVGAFAYRVPNTTLASALLHQPEVRDPHTGAIVKAAVPSATKAFIEAIATEIITL